MRHIILLTPLSRLAPLLKAPSRPSTSSLVQHPLPTSQLVWVKHRPHSLPFHLTFFSITLLYKYILHTLREFNQYSYAAYRSKSGVPEIGYRSFVQRAIVAEHWKFPEDSDLIPVKGAYDADDSPFDLPNSTPKAKPPTISGITHIPVQDSFKDVATAQIHGA